MSITCEIAPREYATWLHWWSVNTDSGNGLVPSGTKPLPEPMLTKFYDGYHKTTMS